jgi:DNA repair photolyase
MSEEKAKASLFPILTHPAEPTGIARLAAEGEHADDGHFIEFRTLKVRSLLNNSVSRRQLRFAKSINPYRGCEFGCRYCYARYTHEFMELRDPEMFERRIFIKQNAAWLLRQELRRLKPDEEIAIGTATDPYQPIERRAMVTRSLLEVFAERRGLHIGIVTKSTLIERDIDLLQSIAANNDLVIHLTITTADAKLARILEPRAPRPDLRFQTVKRLREAGLRTGILCSPLMPGITDSPAALDEMARLAKDAGASFFASSPLFLKPCSKETFMGFVREHFPALERSYAERYATDAFTSEAYNRRVRDMISAVTKKHGLGRRSTDALLTRDVGAVPAKKEAAQLALFSAEAPAAMRKPSAVARTIERLRTSFA